jgi:hypothetical protein
MIRVILQAGLGNILFQYAVGRHLALKHQTSLKLNVGWYCAKSSFYRIQGLRQVRYFDIAAGFYLPVLRCVMRMGLGPSVALDSSPIYCEKHFGFDPEVLEQPDGVCLEGYFQSEKYFKPIASIIRAELAFKPASPPHEIAGLEKEVRSCNSVAVSVRRGDYVGHPLHEVCTPAYYNRAVEYIRAYMPAPRFFIFSDDIGWCRRNIAIPACVFVDLRHCKSCAIEELRLMSACQHHILANSSFAWWGAWLKTHPDKIIVTPHKWFNDATLNEWAMQDTVLPSWIRIEA